MAILQLLVSGILFGSVYSLAAVGLTLIFGVLGVVNFAHGSFVALGMYAAYLLWAYLKLDPIVSAPIALVILGLIGVLLYWLIMSRVSRAGNLAEVVTTFGLLVGLEGLTQIIFTPNPRSVADPIAAKWDIHIGGVVLSGPLLAGFCITVLLTSALALVLKLSKIGWAVRATSEDRIAAMLMGVRVKWIDALVWGIGLGCAGVAGALLMSSYSADPTAGSVFGLVAFFAVAMGGFGSLAGAAIAGIVFGVVQSVSAFYAPGFGILAIVVIYFLVVSIRPKGLMGTA